MPKASVKVMRSYDYCHFEVALSSDEEMTIEQVDEMRKDAMRLVDKAVDQYQIAKDHRSFLANNEFEYDHLVKRAKAIKEIPQSEWTPEQKAIIKRYEDWHYRMNCQYNYEEDWEC